MATDVRIPDGASVEQLQTLFDSAQLDLTSAQAEAKRLVDHYNKSGMTDLNGNALSFDNLKDWKKAFAAGFKTSTGQYGPGSTVQNLETALSKLTGAEAALKQIAPQLNALREMFAPMQALSKLLAAGDIEGAVMLLQTTRARLMDSQLGTQITAMQNRNQQITKLNNDLTVKQAELAKVPTDSNQDNINKREALTKEVGTMKTSIDTLNSDSQIDMIRTQSLVNKRNEAFDTLTNLLGKFQKTIDGIVGNYR